MPGLRCCKQAVSKTIAPLFVIGTLLFAGGCATPSGQPRTTWEYRQAANAEEARQLEQKGWAIAGFGKYTDATGEAQTAYMMRKPKQ